MISDVIPEIDRSFLKKVMLPWQPDHTPVRQKKILSLSGNIDPLWWGSKQVFSNPNFKKNPVHSAVEILFPFHNS